MNPAVAVEQAIGVAVVLPLDTMLMQELQEHMEEAVVQGVMHMGVLKVLLEALD